MKGGWWLNLFVVKYLYEQNLKMENQSNQPTNIGAGPQLSDKQKIAQAISSNPPGSSSVPEAQPSQSPKPQIPAPPAPAGAGLTPGAASGGQKGGKGLVVFILILLILAGLGGGGYYAWSNGWLDDYIMMLPLGSEEAEGEPMMDSTQAMVNDDDQDGETDLSEVSLSSPLIPKGWLVAETSCGGLIGYPSDWKIEHGCLPGVAGSDCLTSSDFTGTIMENNYEVDQGLVLVLRCEALPEDVRANEGGLLADCQSRIALSAEETNVCEMLEIDGRKFVIYKPGEYHLSANNQRFVVEVEPAPPTVFVLLKQILGSFYIGEEMMPDSDMIMDASMPTVVEEATGSAESSGTGVIAD